MKTYILFSLLVFPLSLMAQSPKKIKAHQISHIVEKEIDYEDGHKIDRILKESWYNADELLIEYKDGDKDGDAKVWEKYKYNTDKTLKEKEEYSKNGTLKAKVVYQYTNGLLVKKSYFDKR